MREILFRAKPLYPEHCYNIDENGWIYGSLVHQRDFYGTQVDHYLIVDGDTTEDNSIGYSYMVHVGTIGQFTGLHDVNGTKIFEGDIHGMPGWVVTYVADANESFGMNAGWYVQRDNFESWMQLECHEEHRIIGNIHDNPELMER